MTVLLGGWLLFGDALTLRQAAGMALAVAGMVWYGVASGKPQPPAGPPAAWFAAAPKVAAEGAPLLDADKLARASAGGKADTPGFRIKAVSAV